MGSVPLPQQQTSGDPGLEDASGQTIPYPNIVWPTDATFSDMWKGPRVTGTQTKSAGGVVPGAQPPINIPPPKAPAGAVPLGNPLTNMLQQNQARQMAVASQIGLGGGQVPIQTMGAGVSPGLTIRPIQPFQPSGYIDSPTGSYGSTRAKGIANTIIGASNAIGAIVNKQQQEKQRVLAVGLERILNAQQGMEQSQNAIEQAQAILQDPNSSESQKQQAQATIQKATAIFKRDQDIINTSMADPKMGKQYGKALDINFTNPEENKTPENAALQQAIQTMKQKQQAKQALMGQVQQAQQRQQAGSNMLIPPGGLQAPQQAQAAQAQQGFQPPQATGYAAQLMARTPQVMFDPRSNPKLQEKYIEQQTELMKAQIQEQAQNARFMNEWFLTDKKEQYQSDRMYDMMTHSDAKMMAMIQYGFDKQFQQQQFERAENDRKIAATAAAKAADPETQLNSLRSLQSATTAEHTRYENELAVWKEMRQKYQTEHKIDIGFFGRESMEGLRDAASKGDAKAAEIYNQMQSFNQQIARAEQNIDASANQITELDSLVIEAQRRVLSGKSSSQSGSATGKPSPSKSAPTTNQIPIPAPNIPVRKSEQSPSSTQAPNAGSAGGAVPVPKRLQQSNF